MQRYHATSCTGAVNNSTVGGGASIRDTVQSDLSSLPASFPINSRRPLPLTPYKLKCDKEPLNSRFGPPDFIPQSPNCPEETLTREYLQSGYRETVEGLDEGREIALTQIQTFSSKPVVLKCREAIRKCFRAISESRAQKRKAGQVYGVPLSGVLLTKPGIFPEQRPCGEDFKKRWIEGLSQPHKRLCTLADHVPHGYRKKSLIEVLIRNNVPLVRATWFIKVTYLNQVHASSAGVSSGTLNKTQLSRTEHWTKDVIEYLQLLLDEFLSRNNSHSAPHTRDRSSQMLYAGPGQQRNNLATFCVDGDEPSLHFKWWYVIRLLHWHHSEGLLLPSLIIDWVFSQLQKRNLVEIFQLLLPIIYGVLDTVVISQTYVRTLAGMAVRYIREPSPGGSDLVENSRRAYTSSALIEMLRYLVLAVPDTFVALDCFPLPPSLMSYSVNDSAFISKASEEARKTKDDSSGIFGVFRSKGLDARYQSFSFAQVVSSVQKRADNLGKAACPGYLGNSVAKSVQSLDKALSHGDIREAYGFLFENFCDGTVDDGWIEEVSPCLRSSLKWIGTVNMSFVYSVFFLCEWATCGYRDFRTGPPHDLKFTGRKDFSQVYIATRLLKLKIRDLQSKPQRKNERSLGISSHAKDLSQHNFVGRVPVRNCWETKCNSKGANGKTSYSSNIFESPGPLHDIILCWIDQHEIENGEGLKRLQLFIVELIRSGIFYPQSYVRQLIISGIMDPSVPEVCFSRQKRHYQILKQLPWHFIYDILDEAGIAEGSELLKAMHVYSNERRLLLRGFLTKQYENPIKSNMSGPKQKHHPTFVKDSALSASSDQRKTIQSQFNNLTSKRVKTDADIEELKTSISLLLQIPNLSISADTGSDESQGSVKRAAESISNKVDVVEVSPGCEDCTRAKRQKVNEEKSSCLQGHSPISDDEDTWWIRKGAKSLDVSKVDMPVKAAKQVSKGRQKVVRKTQSLAQLATARIEGSQGASTSHVCGNKVSCPHHRPGVEGEILGPADGIRMLQGGDIVSITKALKQLRFVEKRFITIWLVTSVRQLVEEAERTSPKASQFTRPYVPSDDRSSIRWKLGEDELTAILFLMDVCNDLVSAVKLLLWLLPKVVSNHNSIIHSCRNNVMLQRNVESHACEVGEAFLLSCLRRYENTFVATDLIPEVLTAAIQRVLALLNSNGRVSGSAALTYSRYLLKKYGNVPSVAEWEKNAKLTYDKRLLSELEPSRSLDGEFGFPLGVPAGVEDLDDFLRQKISGFRMTRAGMNMKDLVQRKIEEAHYLFGKERKVFSAGAQNVPSIEKSDDVYQIAQQITMGLMDCIRQTGGAAQEGDPSLVSSAVAAIVSNVGPTLAKMPDFSITTNHLNASSALNIARRILRVHITCLCLLKEAFGERQSRAFEIALATEASSALIATFAPGKASRSQFQSSPDDSNTNVLNETLNNTVRPVRVTRSASAISALIVGAVISGITSLERMVTVFRLKEGLDVIQFIRSIKSTSNGNARSSPALKVDNSVEVCVHWFMLLIGNCRTVCDGLVVVLLGEPCIVALSRMQRMLPLNLIFPPAYSIFAFLTWRQIIFSKEQASREDINQLYQSLTMAIGDVIRHQPFRDVCLRDSPGFYDLVAADVTDADVAARLSALDMHSKSAALIPLRGRLFLNAIIDCRMPLSLYTQDDSNQVSGLGGSKVQNAENDSKLLDKLVNLLDTLQPAKFHWQWIELRLLLNEQALVEKLESHDASLADAIRSLSPGSEKAAASDNENNFIVIILTRLLVRPDAAPLFSELVHLFGKSLEDSMLLQAKWFLGGQDVLFGRKTIRQRLTSIAESKTLSTKAQFWKPWGWCRLGVDSVTNKGDSFIEEGEVVAGGTSTKKHAKGSTQMVGSDSFNVRQQKVTERALIELVLPCIDQGSDESRNTFASDLIKQLNNIEQLISAAARGKHTGPASSGLEGPTNKVNSRKGVRGGSPGMNRRTTGAADSTLPTPDALRSSMSLRLQLLLRLLPVICTDGEPCSRNMRHMLAGVVLRLLGNRVVHEEADLSFSLMQSSQSKMEVESPLETALADLLGESLFDQLLLLFHGLLSGSQPSWLKSRFNSKLLNEFSKDSAGIDHEVVESLQSELDHMQLPGSIRWRIQAAIPVLPSARCSISCQLPSVPISAVASLQPSITVSGLSAGNQPQKSPLPFSRTTANMLAKSKSSQLQQDNDFEIDPWTLLEDGTGSSPSGSNTVAIGGGEHANPRASSWLKGAVRVRRTDLTYIGAVDDDS